MVMSEDDMGCCCCLVRMNSKAGSFGQRLRPMATLSSSSPRSLPIF